MIIATTSTPAAAIAPVTVVVKRITIVTCIDLYPAAEHRGGLTIWVATADVTASTSVFAFVNRKAFAVHDTALAQVEVLLGHHIVAHTAGDTGRRSGGGRHGCFLD